MEINSMSIGTQVRQNDYDRNVGQDNTISGVKKEEVQDKESKVKDTKDTTKDLGHAVDVANKVLFKNNTHLKFKMHEKTKDIMVKIVDDETGEVLKEIPPEKILDMVAKLWEIAGIIIDEKR